MVAVLIQTGFTMDLNSIHSILFNAHIMYSLALGVWAGVMAARSQSISGNFWGAVATSSIQMKAAIRQ